MDELISRQAAIDALEREKTYCTAYRDGYSRHDVFDKYNMGLSDGIKALNNLPPAQPELKWIPVNERLPEDERYVLVTTVSGDVTEAKYWQKEGFWVLKGLAIMSVTAWMPLPESYRGE